MSGQADKNRYEVSFSSQGKNMVLAYVLWFFFGSVGAHRLYLGKMQSAVMMIILLIAGYFTLFITWIALGIWWLLDVYFVYKYVTESNGGGASALGVSVTSTRVHDSVSKKNGLQQKKIATADENSNTDGGPNFDAINALERLAKLKDLGALTQAEFDEEKKRIMSIWKGRAKPR